MKKRYLISIFLTTVCHFWAVSGSAQTACWQIFEIPNKNALTVPVEKIWTYLDQIKVGSGWQDLPIPQMTSREFNLYMDGAIPHPFGEVRKMGPRTPGIRYKVNNKIVYIVVSETVVRKDPGVVTRVYSDGKIEVLVNNDTTYLIDKNGFDTQRESVFIEPMK